MSSNLRKVTMQTPNALRTFVSTTISGAALDASFYEYSVNTSVTPNTWTKSKLSGIGISNKMYLDLGTIVFHDPTKAVGVSNETPDVDVRKVRAVRSDGKSLASDVTYLPLGTRARGSASWITGVNPPACWVGLNASEL